VIIITGASGFIGAYLVDRLIEKGYQIVATNRSNTAEQHFKTKGVTFIQLDVSDENAFQKLPTEDIEAFIHLAALIPAAAADLNAKEFMLCNAVGTYNCLKFCKDHRINRFVSTSSHFATEGYWGLWDREKKKISEEMGVNFKYTGDHTLYIISKIAAEEYAEHFRQEHGMNNVTFRLTGVYGVGRYLSGFETFVQRALKGDPITIYGNPDLVRDHIYIKDVVAALLLAVRNPKVSGLYNLSTGVPRSLREEVEGIVDSLATSDRRSDIIINPRQETYEPASYVYDMTRLRNDGDFETQFSYKEMVLDFVHEHEMNRYSWLRTKKAIEKER
jgi:UDP-glucose 4-epimerase